MIFLSDGNSKVRISCFSSAATPLPQMDGVATATAAVVYSLKVRIRRMQSWQRNHSMCAFHQHPIEPPPRDIPRHRAQRNAPWNIEMYDVPNIEWCMCKCIASDQMLNSLQRKYYFVGAQMHISVYLSVCPCLLLLLLLLPHSKHCTFSRHALHDVRARSTKVFAHGWITEMLQLGSVITFDYALLCTLTKASESILSLWVFAKFATHRVFLLNFWKEDVMMLHLLACLLSSSTVYLSSALTGLPLHCTHTNTHSRYGNANSMASERRICAFPNIFRMR